MMWRTHLIGGIAVLGVTVPLHDRLEVAPLLVFAMLGSLLPDLDASESHIKHLSLGLPFQPFRLPSQVIYRSLGHRGLLHSFWGLAIVAVVAVLPIGGWFGTFAFLGLILGYASHLLLDSMTKTGIPLRYPRRDRFYLLPKGWRVTTSSIEEDLCFGILTAIALLTLFALLPRTLFP